MLEERDRSSESLKISDSDSATLEISFREFISSRQSIFEISIENSVVNSLEQAISQLSIQNKKRLMTQMTKREEISEKSESRSKLQSTSQQKKMNSQSKQISISTLVIDQISSQQISQNQLFQQESTYHHSAYSLYQEFSYSRYSELSASS